jgi:hypothetical protein
MGPSMGISMPLTRKFWSLCLAQKLPTDYVEKLIAYQCHINNLHRKHDYLLGQMGNADETPVFFDMPANTTVDTKSSKSLFVKTTGYEKLRITVILSVLAYGRKLTPFVILKRKNLQKNFLLELYLNEMRMDE